VISFVVVAEALGNSRHQKTDNLDETAVTERLHRCGLSAGVQQSGGRKRDGATSAARLPARSRRWSAAPARGVARRKCAVEPACKLAIDLWRLSAGQTTLANLKLVVPAEMLA
jgi:hypothetical protein